MNSVRPVHAWFFEIAFVRDVGMCVCPPQGYKLHSRDINFDLYNQLNKFVAFRNVTKFIHGRGHCNEASHDKNQPNKAILAMLKLLVSLRGWF